MGSTIVVRAPNWLGDTIMSLPALRALRAGMPGARILLLGPWAPMLEGQGVADAWLPYPPGHGEGRRRGRFLPGERIDLALLLTNSFGSAFEAWRWRAHRRLGFDADARGFLLTERVPLPSPRLHQVDEYRLLVARLGIEVPEEEPRWRTREDPAAEREVAALLQAVGVSGGRGLIGLHLGAAGGSAKRWAPERFGELASRLVAMGLAPLLMGAPSDRDAEAAACSAAGLAVPSLIGRDRVPLLAALLARLSCLVSGDTGVAHLAAAQGIPTVTLFGPTDPRVSGPRSPRAYALVGSAPCAPCFLEQCPIDHPCLREIDPDAVACRVAELVG